MIPKIVGAVLRAVLQTVGGAYVGQGFLTDDQLSQGVGAVIFLVSLAWSIWQKSRTRTVPGGEWNPRAEVRRPKGYRFPKTGGGALGEMLAVLCVAGVAGALGCEIAYRVERYGVTEPPVKDGAITWAAPIDKRPYLIRLLGSFSATPQVTLVTSADGGQSPRVTGITVKAGGEF